MKHLVYIYIYIYTAVIAHEYGLLVITPCISEEHIASIIRVEESEEAGVKLR
jgi:hypothetical protein